MTEVIDSTAVESGTDVAVVERRREVLHPLPTTELVQSFREYQDFCAALLDESDYQAYEQREKVAGSWQTVTKRFKKKSAWRKLATAFDLNVERLHEQVDRDSNGQAIRAMAVYRAISPSGRFQDGDGYCSADEPRFRKDAGREKLENDLRATATTRAKNRAISDLLGTGEVSAEEITNGEDFGGQTSSRPHGPDVQDDESLRREAAQACTTITGDPDLAVSLYKSIASDLNGYMPVAAATALVHIARRAEANQ